WYERLLALDHADQLSALAIALRAATEFPESESFWAKSQELGRELGDLDAVGGAYHRVLDSKLDPAVAEAVGARAADFFEQTLGEPAETVAVLQQVLALAPKARWALDRVKLTLTLHRRHEELLELYDRAISAEPDDALRAELLDEAVLVARASGNEPN